MTQQASTTATAQQPAQQKSATNKKPAAVKAASKPSFYSVVDTSATAKVQHRIHDIQVDGGVQQVEFHYGKPTQMGFSQAMKFLKEGFIVRDPKGAVVIRPTETTLELSSQFGAGKVVAHLHELNRDALYTRAVSLPGGEKLSNTSTASELAEFIFNVTKSKLDASKRAQPRDQVVDDEQQPEPEETLGEGGDDDGDAGAAALVSDDEVGSQAA